MRARQTEPQECDARLGTFEVQAPVGHAGRVSERARMLVERRELGSSVGAADGLVTGDGSCRRDHSVHRLRSGRRIGAALPPLAARIQVIAQQLLQSSKQCLKFRVGQRLVAAIRRVIEHQLGDGIADR